MFKFKLNVCVFLVLKLVANFSAKRIHVNLRKSF